jgi:hypothetical protein
MARSICLWLCLCLLGCGDGTASYGDDPADPEVPPRGYDDILTWLEAGHYQSWACEDAPHPQRPGSPHGTNRICSNAALASFTGTGTYPVGAAGVKEAFDGNGRLRQYAVYRKVTAAAGGDSWYWFEGLGDRIVANDEGDSTCTGCHSGAPQDFVFTVVR